MTAPDTSKTETRQTARTAPRERSAPKAILFDLDDTLLMLMGTVRPAWERVHRDMAADLDGISADDFHAAVETVSRSYWGDWERHRERRLAMERSRREVAHRVVGHLGVSRGDSESRVLANRLARRYSEHRQSLERPFPGALETVRQLRRNYRVALITNGGAEEQRRKILKFALEDAFDAITIEGEFGRGKPDTEVFESTLAAIGASPGEAWMVGNDLHFDIAPAQALGMVGIWHDVVGEGIPENAPVSPHEVITQIPTISELLPRR